VLKTVAHVQAAGNIRRWDDDAVGLTVALGRKIAPFFPGLVPVIFELLWLVSLFHGFGVQIWFQSCRLITL
jgi:hypothetical protein